MTNTFVFWLVELVVSEEIVTSDIFNVVHLWKLVLDHSMCSYIGFGMSQLWGKQLGFVIGTVDINIDWIWNIQRRGLWWQQLFDFDEDSLLSRRKYYALIYSLLLIRNLIFMDASISSYIRLGVTLCLVEDVVFGIGTVDVNINLIFNIHKWGLWWKLILNYDGYFCARENRSSFDIFNIIY